MTTLNFDRIEVMGDERLGRRVRELRLERSLIAADLAARAGISPSFLSQIERGSASPSLKVLADLAGALDVATGALLADAGSRDGGPPAPRRAMVVRRAERKVLRRAIGPEYELLSPDLTGAIEFVRYVLAPGEQSVVEASHEGEEQMLVLRGQVVQVVDGHEYELGPGDALRFDSSLPHRTINRGDAEAEIVSAATPPSF